jgi:hypothetical protein
VTKAIPALIGSAVIYALGMVGGTVWFNLFTWFVEGANLSFSQTWERISANPMFFLPGFGIWAGSYWLGGLVAARLSATQPYFAALIASVLSMAYTAILQMSPTSDVHAGLLDLIGMYLLPVPCALLGARWQIRRARNG